MNAPRAQTRTPSTVSLSGSLPADLRADLSAEPLAHLPANLAAADLASGLAGTLNTEQAAGRASGLTPDLTPDLTPGRAAGQWLRPLTGHWTAAAAAHLSLHAELVRITVLGLRGSAPREPGASMLVDAHGTLGTIGGGNLEWHATAAARELLQDRACAPVRILDLILGPELGQCCGGRVELWLERLTREDLPWLEAARRAAGRPTAGRRTAARPTSGRPTAGGCAPERRSAGRPTVGRLELDHGLVTEVGAGSVSHRLRRSLPGAAALELRRTAFENVSAETSAIRAAGTRDASPRGPAPLAATLLEVLTPRRPYLWIFGAGHVGQALVRLLADLALFDITWIDSRHHLLAPGLPDSVTPLAAAAPAALVGSARPATHYVVMTHDHGLDYDLCRAILRRGDAAWLGLIGSASKAARFRSRLLREGMKHDRLSGLTCPIGVPGITSKLPAAIAIAVAAELLQRHAAGAASVGPNASVSPAAPFTAAAPAFAVASPPGAVSVDAAAPAHALACSGECGSCGAEPGHPP
jgi:xanthine dehydrogenase accessory factor